MYFSPPLTSCEMGVSAVYILNLSGSYRLKMQRKFTHRRITGCSRAANHLKASGESDVPYHIRADVNVKNNPVNTSESVF